MALFNELYYIVDGGTLWAYPLEQKGILSEKDMGHFAYLEGHEYHMYNTYDVHFYASYALAMNWPELELSLQRDIAQATLADYPEMVTMYFNGKPGRRKVYGMVPHDMGWPDEDFWKRVNGYFIHDVNEWKDLNPKFVLQVYRDYAATHDKKFLKSIWPVVKTVIEKVSRFDKDGDGLIENSASPDQTYDTWSVTGLSAYTGGIWLACLLAAAAMAEIMGEKPLGQKFKDRFERGRVAYESKLWNGQYYNYDSSRSSYCDSIMADMLAGQWYAHACGLPPILNTDHIRQSLKKIFNNNVMRFHNGEMGAVNGMRPNGNVDHTNLESQEVWTGTSYALAASMLQEGLERECWQTAKGVVDMTYKKMGYWFQTPEAWDEKGDFRALAYMRPLSIWAIQWAWQRRKKQ
jgi:non-lysosomal glucosylceramidase